MAGRTWGRWLAVVMVGLMYTTLPFASSSQIRFGEVSTIDTVASVALDPGIAPAEGWYTISYQVTSADGHLVTGTTSFMFHGDGNTDMAGLPGAPGATGAGVASSADPLVVGLLVAGVAIALLVALGSVRRLLVSAPE